MQSLNFQHSIISACNLQYPASVCGEYVRHIGLYTFTGTGRQSVQHSLIYECVFNGYEVTISTKVDRPKSCLKLLKA
jgi:hypothetical protein